MDLDKFVSGKTNVSVAFRLFDKLGVGNFGVRCEFGALQAQSLELVAGLDEPRKWRVSRKGAFEAGFWDEKKTPGRQFHVPFIVMTAAEDSEFRLRHGDPASPERIASWLRMSLQAWQEGKCDGVVTYCLDKTPQSPVFPLARKLFSEFRQPLNPSH